MNYLKTLNCKMQTFRCSSRGTCLNQYFHWSPKAVVICLSVQWLAPNVTLHASTAKKPVAKIVNFKRLFLVLCSTLHVLVAFRCEQPLNFTLAKPYLKDFDWLRGTRMENTLSWVLGKTFCILHSSFTSIYCCTSQKIPVASPALINWSIPSGDH